MVVDDIKQIDLEAAVMFCLVTDKPFEVAHKYISEKSFTTESFQKAYLVIKKHFLDGMKIDAVSIFCDNGLDLGWYNQLKEGFVSASNFEWYCKALAQREVARKISLLLSVAVKSLALNPDYHSILNSTVKYLSEIQDKAVSEWKTFEKATSEAHETFDQRCRQKGNIISSGIDTLDMAFSAIHNSRLVILAARPGVGKTALAQQIAIESAMRGKRVAIISMEMSVDELGFRALAYRFDANVTMISLGNQKEYEKCVNSEHYYALTKLPIYIKDDIYDLDHIISALISAKKKYEIDFAIIDHIGLMETDGFESRNDMLGKITRSLKQLTKRLSMPILALSQLNRQGDKEDAEPRLSWLRDSGNIEQDADMVIFLQRESEMHSDGSFLVQPVIAKNRNGMMGDLRPLKFIGKYQKFRTWDGPNG